MLQKNIHRKMENMIRFKSLFYLNTSKKLTNGKQRIENRNEIKYLSIVTNWNH